MGFCTFITTRGICMRGLTVQVVTTDLFGPDVVGAYWLGANLVVADSGPFIAFSIGNRYKCTVLFVRVWT